MGVHDKDIRERFEVSSKVSCLKVRSFLLESNGHKGEGKGAKNMVFTLGAEDICVNLTQSIMSLFTGQWWGEDVQLDLTVLSPHQYLTTNSQQYLAGISHLFKIRAFNIQFLSKGHRMKSSLWITGEVWDLYVCCCR